MRTPLISPLIAAKGSRVTSGPVMRMLRYAADRLPVARYAADRLPVARSDAERLPVAGGTLGAVAAVMVHTDMPRYPAVVREAARVLRPGGVYVHVGVHPCFCGGFADRSDPRRR